MTGRAGSHGPWISFLYFCSPISHQLHPPIARPVPKTPITTPIKPLFHGKSSIPSPSPPRPNINPTPPPAPTTSNVVSVTCPRHDCWRAYRRKTGKSPNTSMLKSVREKTCPVLGRREASTVEAISAAFVLRLAGIFLFAELIVELGTGDP